MSKMSTDNNVDVSKPLANIFVLGSPRSGSTLLGKLLDHQPGVVCVGELALTGQALATGRPCSCDALLEDCPFWQPLLALIRRRVGHACDYRKFGPKLYEALREELQVKTIVDLSKSLAWRMTHRYFSAWRGTNSGYIFLVRDSRGVVASEIRAGGELQKMLRRHRKWMHRFLRFVNKARINALTVYYEDLCHNPERELRRICIWAGLEYSGQTADSLQTEHHFVHSSTSKYSVNMDEIALDERWRSELHEKDRITIEQAMRSQPLLRERYLNE